MPATGNPREIPSTAGLAPRLQLGLRRRRTRRVYGQLRRACLLRYIRIQQPVTGGAPRQAVYFRQTTIIDYPGGLREGAVGIVIIKAGPIKT